ncbi:MAG TPA: tryptophan synthase subunit alpha [Oligoflexia bacterium]|nr:tryptophan synthase subunit alpha [Oligoflexia bacterium]HMP48182.1 tryptophan synthase subunit alpha [Oligoflexia bacterium]
MLSKAEKLKEALNSSTRPLFSIFLMAGYPDLKSTGPLLSVLSEEKIDFIEVGFPFSDPIADGSIIQAASEKSIRNGMHLEILFNQLREIKDKIDTPLIMMGYLNPVLRFGFEKFLDCCEECGVSGLIIPDLPLIEYRKEWKRELLNRKIGFVFLVTPSTSEERIREIDKESPLFIYAVSSYSLTGSIVSNSVTEYLERLASMSLSSPLVVGFGISDRDSFSRVTSVVPAAIIGSAFLSRISDGGDYVAQARDFVREVRGGCL